MENNAAKSLKESKKLIDDQLYRYDDSVLKDEKTAYGSMAYVESL